MLLSCSAASLCPFLDPSTNSTALSFPRKTLEALFTPMSCYTCALSYEPVRQSERLGTTQQCRKDCRAAPCIKLQRITFHNLVFPHCQRGMEKNSLLPLHLFFFCLFVFKMSITTRTERLFAEVNTDLEHLNTLSASTLPIRS